MKAIVTSKYGSADGLVLRDLPKPAPADGEVLVRVRASTVTAGDVMLRRLTFAPLFWSPVRRLIGMPPRKRTPGHELAGIVEATGRNVAAFQAGRLRFRHDHRAGDRGQCRVRLSAGAVGQQRAGVDAAESLLRGGRGAARGGDDGADHSAPGGDWAGQPGAHQRRVRQRRDLRRAIGQMHWERT